VDCLAVVVESLCTERIKSGAVGIEDAANWVKYYRNSIYIEYGMVVVVFHSTSTPPHHHHHYCPLLHDCMLLCAV
jgi:hypothetical protein